MSITVTSEEIAQFRSILSGYPDAMVALDEIEDCEGDLEDASIALAIRAGQEPDTSDRWIDGLAKRWRHIVCQTELKQQFETGLTADLVTTLAVSTTLPLKLAVPVAIYVVKVGAEEFCRSFEVKIQ